MKILYVATIGGFMPFFKTFIRELLDEGHEVDIATNMSQYPLPEYYKEWGCGIYQLSCSRSPLSKGNIEAVKELRTIVTDKQYDIVHCHTPIASACTRLACKQVRKKGTKVVYTAHGFHFYSGAPIKNWLLFYPIEKICSWWTDALITINKEDYSRAKKRFRIKNIYYVPGVGVDVNHFSNNQIDKEEKKLSLTIPGDAFVLLSVGELNTNKNHQIVIRALAELHDCNTHYVVAGRGDQYDNLTLLAKELNVSDKVHLIGYRNDMPELYKMADVFVLPSLREGLNVSLMEAMSSGLPCVVSDIRGNRDVVDENGGVLVDPLKKESFINGIQHIKESTVTMGIHNIQKAKMFDYRNINSSIMKIYFDQLNK